MVSVRRQRKQDRKIDAQRRGVDRPVLGRDRWSGNRCPPVQMIAGAESQTGRPGLAPNQPCPTKKRYYYRAPMRTSAGLFVNCCCCQRLVQAQRDQDCSTTGSRDPAPPTTNERGRLASKTGGKSNYCRLAANRTNLHRCSAAGRGMQIPERWSFRGMEEEEEFRG